MDSQQNTPPIPPNFLDMNQLLEHLFLKINKLEEDVRNCHHRHIEATEFQNGALVKALERNTIALENIEKYLSQSKRTQK